LRLLYIDTWAPIPGEGQRWELAREVWSDISPVIAPKFENVVARPRAVSPRAIRRAGSRGKDDAIYPDLTGAELRISSLLGWMRYVAVAIYCVTTPIRSGAAIIGS
jgi:hypothetical protein